MKLHCFDNSTTFRDTLIALISDEATRDSDTPFGIMLAGGGTPLAAYRAIAEAPVLASEQLILMFSDDRHVAQDSPDSNYGNSLPMATAMGVGYARTLRVRAELSLDDAGRQYADDLQAFLDGGGSCTLGLIGLGTDGHTCSLFNLDDAAVEDSLTLTIQATGGFDRVSVTRAFLQTVDRIIVLATGEAKREMLNNLLHRPETIPAGIALAGHQNVEIWTDVAGIEP
jgi:6-phosphogluconolactonase/glucosamine-6-phosphate isomerase/deaminase